ncbi:hypothetical protein KKC60_01085 [Patescibacteria group bacterium]|nr:hypothetical protein [Patescibacteria group bacterium]
MRITLIVTQVSGEVCQISFINKGESERLKKLVKVHLEREFRVETEEEVERALTLMQQEAADMGFEAKMPPRLNKGKGPRFDWDLPEQDCFG